MPHCNAGGHSSGCIPHTLPGSVVCVVNVGVLGVLGTEERREALLQCLRIEALLTQLAVDPVGGEVLRSTGQWIDRQHPWIAGAVGICAALRTGDWLSTSQAGPAFAVAKGSASASVAAECLGRSDGACHGRSGLLWFIDHTSRLATWPNARLAVSNAHGWATAGLSPAIAVIKEGSATGITGACLRQAVQEGRPLMVISIATEPARDPALLPAIRCADPESITQATQEALDRARSESTGVHLRLWLPTIPAAINLGQVFVRSGMMSDTDLASLITTAQREAMSALRSAHGSPEPRPASAFQYVG